MVFDARIELNNRRCDIFTAGFERNSTELQNNVGSLDEKKGEASENAFHREGKFEGLHTNGSLLSYYSRSHSVSLETLIVHDISQ